METKALVFGIVGFLCGGLVVSIAATQNPQDLKDASNTGMTMTQMTESLKDKRGDAYDAAFIASMIDHHEGAIEMAKLSAERAKHDEIRQLSQDIVTAQKTEIDRMKQWQADWGYEGVDEGHTSH